jgi:hypothetical protein
VAIAIKRAHQPSEFVSRIVRLWQIVDRVAERLSTYRKRRLHFRPHGSDGMPTGCHPTDAKAHEKNKCDGRHQSKAERHGRQGSPTRRCYPKWTIARRLGIFPTEFGKVCHWLRESGSMKIPPNRSRVGY